MTTNATWIKIDAGRVAGVLEQEVAEKLSSAEELVLDFSSVVRIDPNALRAMEDLARLAGARSVRIICAGVNLGVYKALTLAKIAQRFSFLS
jgi:anti-anti-sigma regulatory factor